MLTVIDNCNNCCACCLEQESPPGYLAIAMGIGWPKMGDVARYQRLPEELKVEIVAYGNRLKAMKPGEKKDNACIWLDKKTRRCKHHKWRPSICREFETGCDACRNWRRTYPQFSQIESDPSL